MRSTVNLPPRHCQRPRRPGPDRPAAPPRGPGRGWPRSGRSRNHADRHGTAAPGRPPL